VLAALAARGRDYRQATTPHPFGPFARAALLTGKPSPENGVVDYFDSLPRDSRTVAHTLRDRGYTTAWFGKWHLAKRDPDAALVGEAHARMVVPPEDRGGFGFWEGFESGFLLNDPWLHGTRLPQPTQFPGYQSDVLCDRAAEWLATAPSPSRPWFAVVSLESPHPPYGAPVGEGIETVDTTGISVRANVSDYATERARRELAGYYRHVAATDRAIGRLVNALPAETIIVVTSVHGDMHGSHGLFRKGWPHEESVRVPLVVVGAPGAAGASDEPVSLLDLPAMVEAWSENNGWCCDRERALISMPSVVGLPDQCDRAWLGWRSAARKVILNTDGSPWLEFDLTNDPFELSNLSAR
jgi:arylsulfatase A-like enzyme